MKKDKVLVFSGNGMVCQMPIRNFYSVGFTSVPDPPPWEEKDGVTICIFLESLLPIPSLEDTFLLSVQNRWNRLWTVLKLTVAAPIAKAQMSVTEVTSTETPACRIANDTFSGIGRSSGFGPPMLYQLCTITKISSTPMPKNQESFITVSNKICQYLKLAHGLWILLAKLSVNWEQKMKPCTYLCAHSAPHWQCLWK